MTKAAVNPVWAGIALSSQGKGSPGRFRADLIREGWSYCLDAFQPAYDAGCWVLFLHRPTGESLDGGEVMNLDSRVDLMDDPEARKVLDGIPDFLEAFAKRFPNARIVAYFGSSREPDLTERLDAGNFSAYIDRYVRSLIPWINCDFVDLVFDYAGSFREGDPHGETVVFLAHLLATRGRKVYIEPQPKPWSVTAPLPWVCLERWWQKHADQGRTNGIRWWVGNADAGLSENQWQGDKQDWVNDCVKTGCGMIVTPEDFANLKLPTLGVGK